MDNSFRWYIDGRTYVTARVRGPCPKCTKPNSIVALPLPLLKTQPDDTTYVCHPILGGCNHGFARDVQ